MEKNVGDTDALVRIVAGAVAGLTSLEFLLTWFQALKLPHQYLELSQ